MMRQHVVVEGIVQGVGYRYACEQKARELGVKGWVRNLDDGGVEAVFEGDDRSVTQMVEWARRGPRHARVTDFEVRAEEPQGEKRFDIKF